MEGLTETVMMNLRVTQSSGGGGVLNRGVAGGGGAGSGVTAANVAVSVGGAGVGNLLGGGAGPCIATGSGSGNTSGMLLDDGLALGVGATASSMTGVAGTASVLNIGSSVVGGVVESTLLGPPSSPSGLRYTSDKHPKLALTNINMLQKRRELCDVVLMVGSRKIFAHRLVLVT